MSWTVASYHISIYLFICSLPPPHSRFTKAETSSFPICIPRPWNSAWHIEGTLDLSIDHMHRQLSLSTCHIVQSGLCLYVSVWLA